MGLRSFAATTSNGFYRSPCVSWCPLLVCRRSKRARQRTFTVSRYLPLPTTRLSLLPNHHPKAEQRRRGLDDNRQRGKRRGRKPRRTPEERAEINRRTPEEIEAIRAERRAKKERLEASEDAARAQVAAEVGEVVDAADVQIEAQAVLIAGASAASPVCDEVGLGNRWPGPRIPSPQ